MEVVQLVPNLGLSTLYLSLYIIYLGFTLVTPFNVDRNNIPNSIRLWSNKRKTTTNAAPCVRYPAHRRVPPSMPTSQVHQRHSARTMTPMMPQSLVYSGSHARNARHGSTLAASFLPMGVYVNQSLKPLGMKWRRISKARDHSKIGLYGSIDGKLASACARS